VNHPIGDDPILIALVIFVLLIMISLLDHYFTLFD
jgi:hypothetical protein